MEQVFEFLLANVEISIMAVIFVMVELYKKTTDKFYKFIPLVAGVLGVTFMVLTKGAFTFETFSVGLISGWATTGGFETIKNIVKGE